jgi:transcriptional regulator with XRE-family HTH domain
LTLRGIPCGSGYDGVKVSPGKRTRRQAVIWRSSHVRNLIANRTYMGEHTFGKRTKNPRRKLIVRAVPAIVTAEIWEGARQVLRSNQIMAKRNGRTPFLLRGLIKCGLCGLTFSGFSASARQPDHYYHCNGRQFARGLYGLSGKKCPAKGINGRYVEQVVWADIESFLRDPGEILEHLRERLSMKGDERQRRQKELEQFRNRLGEKTIERERMLGLFRRGRIDDATLDEQLNLIEVEADSLRAEIEMAERAMCVADQTAQLKSAEELLTTLRQRLDGAVSPELKRRIIEALVESIRADTVESWGVAESRITVTYRFAQPSEAAALVLPRLHNLTSRTRPAEKLETLGDHLRRRRLTLKLTQRQVAKQIGVDASSIHNWEANVSKPSLGYMPAILRFLGYNPVPPGDGCGDRLVQCRTALGLSQKEAARQIGVDQGTLARWERGERQPAGVFADRVTRFLNDSGVYSSVEVERTA